jgi:CubicO group peptidase (beta-lactamase class C family)
MSPRAAEDLENAVDMGLDPERLGRLREAIERDTAKGIYDGAVFLVARSGTVVVHEAIGHTDLESKRVAKKDDVFFLMSITKQLTTAMVLMRIDRGEFSLLTPVAEIVPEFGVKGKQHITVYHLLTHTSGIVTEMPQMMPLDQVGDLQAFVAAICEQPLRNIPGQRVSYAPFTAHAVLAEMVRRVDGGERPVRQIMAEDIFQPLGMKDTALGLRSDLRARSVPIIYRDRTKGLFEPALIESINIIATETTEFPAGGGVSTAWDIYRFAEMLRCGGELDGARLLSPAIVQLAMENHTGSAPIDLFDYASEMYGWPEMPSNLGLGFFLRGEGVHPTALGFTTSPWTFAGLGAGSMIFWVDPERDLTFVCLTAGLLEEAANFRRFQRLSDLLVAAVVD